MTTGFKQNFLNGMGERTFAHGTKMAAMPIMVKITFKILLFQNHWTDDIEAHHVALVFYVNVNMAYFY